MLLYTLVSAATHHVCEYVCIVGLLWVGGGPGLTTPSTHTIRRQGGGVTYIHYHGLAVRTRFDGWMTVHNSRGNNYLAGLELIYYCCCCWDCLVHSGGERRDCAGVARWQRESRTKLYTHKHTALTRRRYYRHRTRCHTLQYFNGGCILYLVSYIKLCLH